MATVNDKLNGSAGLLSLITSLIMCVATAFVQTSFDRLFDDLDRLKESQAILQTKLEANAQNMHDIRLAVKDSEGQIQNLTVRVSVLEEKISKVGGVKNAPAGR